MCGIAGFIDFTKKSDKQTLINMTDVLHHRGPDDSGYSFYENEYANIGLGHRRLSILDLSSHGHQPMSFDHLEIVYNGEVYNFKEIRTELEKHGYTFYSNSDTEVILKAYHKWGVEAVDRFNGMFAIAIYDKHAQKLTMIRDRAGVKPLYYYFNSGLFMFASELKSFHENREFKKEIDNDSLALFLQYGYIPQPYSIFKNTFKLKAGHYLELDLKTQNIDEIRYWDVIDFYNKPKLDITENEAIKETEELLKSAFEYRMVSDVPVGVFLSGGYDSSAVTAFLQSNRTEKLKTFSIGFRETKFNEAHHAKKVAAYLGTDHTEYYCTQKDALEILPKLPEIWDEPFADNSVIPTTLVSQLARKDVKVSLSADGGDELFGGYNKYVQAPYYYRQLTKFPASNKLARLLKLIPPEKTGLDLLIRNFPNKYKLAVSLMSSENQTRAMQNFQQFFTDTELSELLTQKQNKVATSFDEIDLLNDNLSDLDKMMAIDYKTYLVDDILTKVDKATMSVGLEGREPLLDYRLIEYMAGLDTNFKIHGSDKKYLLKQITHKYLPKKIMDRPKMGFSTPIVEWFSDELVHYINYYLDAKKIERQGLFDVEKVLKIKNQYLAGKKYLIGKIWNILVFQMWYEKWIK